MSERRCQCRVSLFRQYGRPIAAVGWPPSRVGRLHYPWSMHSQWPPIFVGEEIVDIIFTPFFRKNG